MEQNPKRGYKMVEKNNVLIGAGEKLYSSSEWIDRGLCISLHKISMLYRWNVNMKYTSTAIRKKKFHSSQQYISKHEHKLVCASTKQRSRNHHQDGVKIQLTTDRYSSLQTKETEDEHIHRIKHCLAVDWVAANVCFLQFVVFLLFCTSTHLPILNHFTFRLAKKI